MSNRLQKRELGFLEKLNISNDDLAFEVSKRYLNVSSIMYQDTFSRLNEIFFNNELPSTLIFGANLKNADGTFYHSNTGYIAVQDSLDMFQRECVLLHELQHYYNFIKGVDENSTHGSEWARSCQHILDKLNIPLEATELSEDELKSFPQQLFDNYNINLEWDADTKLYLNPIADDYIMVRKPDEEIEIYNSVVCTGNATTDLQELISTFGDEYKTALKDILC